MANEEQLALLRRSLDEWNAWRLDNLNEEIDLTEADLTSANLWQANLSGANLNGADLTSAILHEADLTLSTMTGCKVYGVSAWNLKLEGAEQSNLVITKSDEPAVIVDNLEVAQFI